MFSVIIFKLASGDFYGFIYQLFLVVVVFGGVYLLTHLRKFRKLKFEVRYFCVMVPFFVSVLVTSYLNSGLKRLILILIFGVIGMITETVLSWVWSLFFKNRIYYYTSDTLAHAYTSWLNFIPWALGGSMFVALYLFSIPSVSESSVLFVIFPTVIGFIPFILLALSFQGFTKEFRVRKLVLLLTPFLTALTVVYVLTDKGILLFAILLGLFGVIFEYLFGKSMRILFGKQLWVYQYMPIDSGLSSIVNFIPWSAVGFVFVGVYLVIQKFL